MTCALDKDCLDAATDPYGGSGCNAGEWGTHCRFCGFESDGVKYPPCPDSDKGTSAKLSADEASRFLQLHRMSRDKCLTCVDTCKDMVCPKVCGGLTDEGDDMTCEADAYCMDDSIDPYGGMGCNAGSKGQHCRFCGFEADGVKYPPCSKGKAAATPATATATSSLLTRPSSSPSAAFGGVPTRPLLPMVLVGIVLLATVFAAGIAVGARRRSATSGLLASEAAGSWSPVAVKLSAEGDYDRFGR